MPPSKDNPPLVVRQMPMRGLEPAAWLFIGFSGPGAASADLPALRVLTVALGEMPRNRLEKRLLSQSMIPGFDDNGAQQATAQWTSRSHSGELVIFAQVKPDHIEDVKNALLDEVRKLREAPLTAPELERARHFAVGGWAVDRENLRERAFHSAFAATTGLGPDTRWPEKVANVTAAQIQKAAAQYLQNYAVTLIMPEE